MNYLECPQYETCKKIFERCTVHRCMNPTRYHDWETKGYKCEFYEKMKETSILYKQMEENRTKKKEERERLQKLEKENIEDLL